jgi:hypothetical protein
MAYYPRVADDPDRSLPISRGEERLHEKAREALGKVTFAVALESAKVRLAGTIACLPTMTQEVSDRSTAEPIQRHSRNTIMALRRVLSRGAPVAAQRGYRLSTELLSSRSDISPPSRPPF